MPFKANMLGHQNEKYSCNLLSYVKTSFYYLNVMRKLKKSLKENSLEKSSSLVFRLERHRWVSTTLSPIKQLACSERTLFTNWC